MHKPPVADLVAEALDDDRAVRRHDAGRVALLAEEDHQVAGGALVEEELVPQPLERLLLRHGDQLARRLADRRAELVRPADALALPERHRARHARRRGDEHPVARDLLDPPGRRAEQEGLAGAGLVDHLLVELADSSAAVDEMDAVEPAVGDRPGVRDGEAAHALAPADDPARAVPDDARPQLGELVRRVAAGEHVEHVLELRARQVAERPGAADELVEVVDGDLLVGADGDDLLREHVERVPRDHRLLDQAVSHPLRDDGRFEEVGPELREDAALRDGAQLVARAADPLQAARHRLRRLDLDDEVDGAHVDAELERRGRDEAGDLAALEQLLDLDALLARERAVVRAGELALGELVQAQREPLGEAAVVDEDDRRAVLLDEAQELRVDRRPDRRARRLAARAEQLGDLGPRARLAHVLERHDDLEVELLADARVDEPDRPAAGHEAPDLLQRALGRGEADPLHGLLDEAVEPLHGEREMRAALRPRDGVHLVEDQRPDAAEHLPAARGEQQEERLGRRDQDVRRLAQHRGALALRRVAGADADAELRAQAGERPAQVALDVVVERLQRGHVDEAKPLAGRRVQPVDPVEERGERLPRAGRRLDQDMLAGGDGRPAELLRGRRARERGLEPRARLGGEMGERVQRSQVTCVV